MITHSILIPDGLERRFVCVRSVEQISRAETHEGGAMDHTIGVQRASRPECLCHSLQLLTHIFLRDLVQVSADNHVRRPTEPALDKFREMFPITTGKFIERHNGYDCIRFACHEAGKRFKIIGLGKRGQACSLGKKREAPCHGHLHQCPGGKSVTAEVVCPHSEILTGKSMN